MADERPPRRALLVVNPNSRRGAELAERAADALAAVGIEPRPARSARRTDVSRAILAARDEVDLVVVGGGDGTLNAAAWGVWKTGLPLGILPMGTGNDLALTLGLPADLETAATVIAAGSTRSIDLGLVNGHPFFNVASIGLSAELAQTLSRDLKQRLGKLGYGVAAARVLARARPFHATITSEGARVRVSTLQIAIGNGRYYGGGNVVEPSARIDDQRLDLYSLEFSRAWKLAVLARAFRQGAHGTRPEVRTLSGREFTVHTRRPRPVNADGELVTNTPAHFTIAPAAVRIFAPAEPEPAPAAP